MLYYHILCIILFALQHGIGAFVNRLHHVKNNKQRTLSRQDENELIPAVAHHHTSIRTSNIESSIKFYSLLGFETECKFRSGPANAAWLIIPASRARIELIEIPPHMSSPSKAIDVVTNPTHIGYNHLSLDVTNCTKSLEEWMKVVNSTSYERFQKSIRTAIPIQEQLIGSNVYDVAWIYDADGAAIELLYLKSTLNQTILSGWLPWDGKGFTN